MTKNKHMIPMAYCGNGFSFNDFTYRNTYCELNLYAMTYI